MPLSMTAPSPTIATRMWSTSSVLYRPELVLASMGEMVTHALPSARHDAGMSNADRPTRVGLLAPMPSEFSPLVKALSLQRGEAVYTGNAGPIELVAAKTGIGTR